MFLIFAHTDCYLFAFFSNINNNMPDRAGRFTRHNNVGLIRNYCKLMSAWVSRKGNLRSVLAKLEC